MRADMRSAAGFTLIELVIVMVIISTGLLGIVSLFGSSSTSLSTNETLQQVTQYAQECAENVLATRRNNGFDNTFSCGTVPSGFTRTLTVGAIYTGGSTGACPDTTNCRDVTITVASTANAALTSTINLLLVNY